MAITPLRKLLYPFLVGLLLGWLQTGLFFQFTATFSSGFGTYLMITLCWLAGSALGVSYGAKLFLRTHLLLILALGSYWLCAVLLLNAPFETGLWPVYAGLVILIGMFPGLFFARMAPFYRARNLFLLENNGFIVGLASGTLLLLLLGRPVLWLTPGVLALMLFILHEPFNERPMIAEQTLSDT